MVITSLAFIGLIGISANSFGASCAARTTTITNNTCTDLQLMAVDTNNSATDANVYSLGVNGILPKSQSMTVTMSTDNCLSGLGYVVSFNPQPLAPPKLFLCQYTYDDPSVGATGIINTAFMKNCAAALDGSQNVTLTGCPAVKN